jgi:pimeloyl-ACP methyl ester carboxylesterase
MSAGTAPAWPRNGGRAAARRSCCCTRASRTGGDGAPGPELDAGTRRLDLLLEAACATRDADEANRLETWPWPDGPGQGEGRAGGAAREMNAVIIANGEAGARGAAGVDAWRRLSEITVPVTVACGDLDVPFIVDRCRQLAGQLPVARHFVPDGMAHQPCLESASTVAQPIRSAVTGG